MSVYRLVNITDKDNNPKHEHAWDTVRKIHVIELDRPMQMFYVEGEKEGMVRTTTKVKEIASDQTGWMQVKTRNSVYNLQKIKE